MYKNLIMNCMARGHQTLTLTLIDDEPEVLENWFKEFFRGIEDIKVKNLSDVPMPGLIKAYLSLGAKFTPVQLNVA